MSLHQNENLIESLQQQLVEAIENGDREKELQIRQRLIDSGLLSADQIEEISNYL